MENFIKFIREDGMIEYRHPNYEQMMAEAESLVPDEAPEISAEQMALDNLNTLRKVRDNKIAETDWWVLPDRTPTQEQLDYRQALRDITNIYTSLNDVIWPEKPE